MTDQTRKLAMLASQVNDKANGPNPEAIEKAIAEINRYAGGDLSSMIGRLEEILSTYDFLTK